MSIKNSSSYPFTNRKEVIISGLSNRVQNNQFENPALSPWITIAGEEAGKIFITSVNPHSGLQAVRMISLTDQSVSLIQRITRLRRGRRYQATFWVSRMTPSRTGQLRVSLGSESVVFPTSSIPLSTYMQVNTSFFIPMSEGSTFAVRVLEIRVSSTVELTDVVVDDVSLHLLPA